MPNNAQEDLNTVIASAVQARIETEVATALAGSDIMAQYVAAALHQKITIRDQATYRDRQTTFLREAIDQAIQTATAAAVRKLIAEEAAQIEAEVGKVLRKNAKTIAEQLVGKVVDAAASPYGVKVELSYPNND